MDNLKEIIALIRMAIDSIEKHVDSVLDEFEKLKDEIQNSSKEKNDEIDGIYTVISDYKQQIEKLKEEFNENNEETEDNIKEIRRYLKKFNETEKNNALSTQKILFDLNLVMDQLKDNIIIKMQHDIKELKEKKEGKKEKRKEVFKSTLYILSGVIIFTLSFLVNRGCNNDSSQNGDHIKKEQTKTENK